MQSNPRITLLTVAILTFPPAALSQNLVDCNDLRRGAIEAQARYVQIHTPRIDPLKTFDDATASCLEGIAMLDIGFTFQIPNLGDIDALLRSMATKLFQRTCQAATQQFNRAINDAMQPLSAPIAQITSSVPRISGGISTDSAGITIRDDGGSTFRNTINSATDRVINFVR